MNSTLEVERKKKTTVGPHKILTLVSQSGTGSSGSDRERELKSEMAEHDSGK